MIQQNLDDYLCINNAQSLKLSNIQRYCYIEIISILSLLDFNIFFSLVDQPEQILVQQGLRLKFAYNHAYNVDNQQKIQFSLYQYAKLKQKDELFEKSYFKISNFLGLDKQIVNSEFIVGDNQIQFSFYIGIQSIRKIIECPSFVLQNTKEQQILFQQQKLNDTLLFRQLIEENQLLTQQYSLQKSILSCLEIIFPGMKNDYDNDDEQIQAIAMYEEMLQTITQNILQKEQTDQDINKIKELIDSIFLMQQNDFLQKQIILFPIFADNLQVVSLSSLILEQFEKSSEFKFLPIYYKHKEELNLVGRLTILLGLIYNFFKVFTFKTNSVVYKDGEVSNLQQFLENCQNQTDIDLYSYGNIQYQVCINKLKDELDINDYLIQNSFVTIPYLKMLILVDDDDHYRSELFSIISQYNQLSKVNSLQQIINIFNLPNSEENDIIQKSIKIMSYLSQICLIPPTTIPPAVLYPIPQLNQQYVQDLKEFQQNNKEENKYFYLLYCKMIKQGNICDQIANISTKYHQKFIKQEWYALLFKLQYCKFSQDFQTQLSTNFISRLQNYLMCTRVGYLNPIIVDAKCVELYEKESINKKGVTIKQICQLLKLEAWENIQIQSDQDTKLKVCVGTEHDDFDITNKGSIYNKMTSLVINDIQTNKNQENNYIQKHTNLISVENTKPKFILKDQQFYDNQVSIEIPQKYAKYIYFYHDEDVNAKNQLETEIIEFAKKRDQDDVYILIDDTNLYTIEEFVITKCKTTKFILVSIM